MAFSRIQSQLSDLDTVSQRWARLGKLEMKIEQTATTEHSSEVNRIKAKIRSEIIEILPSLRIWLMQAAEFDRKAAELGRTDREDNYVKGRVEVFREAAKMVGMVDKFEQELAN